MMRFLVIGGTGVAGTAAIKAVRECYGTNAHITAMWYGPKPDEITIDGADSVLFGDISADGVWEQIRNASGKQFEAVFYATAMGEVGFPARMATAEQITASNLLSFDPLAVIEAQLNAKIIVAYSTFFNLAHQLVTYGAMAHSKAAIEQWALKDGKSRHVCIRAGAFHSGSSHAIKLLVRRNAKKLAKMDDPILKKHFTDVKASVAVDTLQQAVFDEERETFGDTGTDEAALIAAHLMVFNDPAARFVCLCGKKRWLDAKPITVPS
jgi:hypothetical protein